MQGQTEIIDLTDCFKDEILERIKEILEQSYIEKFTLLLKRKVHKSKTQKKIQSKENAINNIKHRFSQTHIPESLLAQKNDANNRAAHTGENFNTLGNPSRAFKNRVHQKSSKRSQKNSRITDNSFLNMGGIGANYCSTPVEEMPKSLMLYHSGEYQMALIEFFDEQKQLKKKIQQLSNQQQQLQGQSQDGQQDFLSDKISKFSKVDSCDGRIQEKYAKLMLNIGNCYFYQKDYDKAIKYYKMDDMGQFLDEKLMGQRYNNLGSCYAQKKQNQQSLKCFNEALKIYSQYSEMDCSNLLKNIGAIYFRSGMYPQAETYFEQSINERKQKSPDNEHTLLQTYYKLGLCQKSLGKYEEALNTLLFGLHIAEKGYELHDQFLKVLAEIYEIQEKYGESLVYYEKLSDIYESEERCQGEIYESVGKIHQRLGNFVEHERFMKMAYGEYRRFNNERKMSELSSPKYALE